LPRSSRAPGALDVVVVVHPMAVDLSKSSNQLGESGTLYGSATIERATSLSQVVWKSRSCARLDLSRLPWSMRLILLRQIHGHGSALRPSIAAAATAGVASLAAAAVAGYPCVLSVAAGSRKGIFFMVTLFVFGGVHAVPPILWLARVRFRHTCSTGALVPQWTRMWLVRVLALGIYSIGAASLGSR
jgi:hypothetical protein